MITEARTRLTPKLIDSLYVEAMVLADEARSYFDRNGREDRLGLEPMARVGFSCESLKVTTRLMHVIQKAVEAGELSSAQARTPSRRLGEAAESDLTAVTALPTGALALVRASQELYARVRRLADGSSQAEPQSSPALSLLSRLERSL
jgi:regulator of CtrA degradation